MARTWNNTHSIEQHICWTLPRRIGVDETRREWEYVHFLFLYFWYDLLFYTEMCMNWRMKRQNNNTSNNNVSSMERLEGRKGHKSTLSTCWSSSKYTYSSHCNSEVVELRGIQVYRAQDLPGSQSGLANTFPWGWMAIWQAQWLTVLLHRGDKYMKVNMKWLQIIYKVRKI